MNSQYSMFFPFQWKKTQEERTKIIEAGLKKPTSDVSKAITEAEPNGKVDALYYHILSIIIKILLLIHF